MNTAPALPRLVEEERMTGRARAYLIVTAYQHFALAVFLGLASAEFTSSSFTTIRDISYGSLQPWAWAFGLVSLIAVYAAMSGSEPVARAALTCSAVTFGFWAMSFLVGIFTEVDAGPSAAIIWSALVAKDLIVGAQPLSAPLEPLIRRVRQQSSGSA